MAAFPFPHELTVGFTVTPGRLMVSTTITAIRTFSTLAGTTLRCACNSYVRRQITLTVHFTLADPHFDTDDSVSGEGFSKRIVNVRTKGMQWNASVFVLLGTCDFRTTQTTGAIHFDSFCTHAHC